MSLFKPMQVKSMQGTLKGAMQSLALFLTLLLSLPLMAQPVSWLATKGDKTYVLFGSVHLASSDMYPLPAKIMNYLANSDGLIVETDVNSATKLVYPEKTTPSKAYLTPQQQGQLSNIAKQLNLPATALLQSAPWMSAVTIQLQSYQKLGFVKQKGIDHYLVRQARINEVPLFNLESLQYQMDLFTRYPEDGKELLIATMQQFHTHEQDTRCMMKSWQYGDIDNLTTLSNLNEISEFASERFLIQRNKDWVETLKGNSLTKTGGRYLVAVGTLHLVGEYGLPKLLQQQGFEVRPFTLGEKAPCQFAM